MRTLVLFLLAIKLGGCAYYFGNSWQHSFRKIPPSEYPTFNQHPSRISDSELKNHPLVLHWAEQELIRPEKKGQRGPERILLAKLVAGEDIELVNEYLLESVPWGNSGTSGALNPKGDYDFTTVILAAILHRFGDDSTLLWDTTEEHIARNLLIEEGGKPHTKTPRTMHIMKDTENHILMTNISKYLKNQWMFSHGEIDSKYDNSANGMERFLLDNLDELHITGQYEFNSKPYEGYTISALLILHSYADSEVLKKKSQEVLDSWAWEYMQTSSDFRKSAPFRRRMARFKSTSLTDNASTSIMKAWYLEHLKRRFEVNEVQHNHHQALSALLYDYRPPAEIWTKDVAERLLLIGHGKGSCLEIHSRGNGFLLSAGGFQRGEASQIVTRPIVLMLDDGITDLRECFHINGKGKWQTVDSLGNWKLYQPIEGVSVVTYCTQEFGLIYIPNQRIKLSTLAQLNPDPTNGVFKTLNKSIEFDVKSPKGKWVISAVNGEDLNRKTDSWKRMEVESY